jgi:hypothetical protein
MNEGEIDGTYKTRRETQNVYDILVGNHQGKRQLGRQRREGITLKLSPEKQVAKV